MASDSEKYEDDDGRVICNMDVEGMPRRSLPGRAFRPRQEKGAAQAVSQGGGMTQSESRRYIFYSVLAGMSIVLVFAVTWVLFILFCIYVWFR